MAERHVDILQATIRLIDPVLRLVLGNFCIRIPSEVFREDYLIGPGAPNRECIAHDTPLRLTIQTETLPKIVDESNQHHPARVTVLSDCLRGLQKMLDLREVSVRIAVID